MSNRVVAVLVLIVISGAAIAGLYKLNTAPKPTSPDAVDIRGTISLTGGTPLTQAEVNVNDPTQPEDSAAYTVATMTVNPDGSYAFLELPPQQYVISVQWQVPSDLAGKIGNCFGQPLNMLGEWLVATARNDFTNYVFAVQSFDEPFAAGQVVQANLNLECE